MLGVAKFFFLCRYNKKSTVILALKKEAKSDKFESWIGYVQDSLYFITIQIQRYNYRGLKYNACLAVTE